MELQFTVKSVNRAELEQNVHKKEKPMNILATAHLEFHFNFII